MPPPPLASNLKGYNLTDDAFQWADSRGVDIVDQGYNGILICVVSF